MKAFLMMDFSYIGIVGTSVCLVEAKSTTAFGMVPKFVERHYVLLLMLYPFLFEIHHCVQVKCTTKYQKTSNVG